MKYALVLVPKEANKELIVSTKYIKNFVNYNRWTKNNVFHYQRDERKFKCVILHIADTQKELLDPDLRIRYPVITNPSALDSSSDEEEEKSGITSAKTIRKNKKQAEIRSKKQRTENIIELYKTSSETNLPCNTKQINDIPKKADYENADLPISSLSTIDTEENVYVEPIVIIKNQTNNNQNAGKRLKENAVNEMSLQGNDFEDDLLKGPSEQETYDEMAQFETMSDFQHDKSPESRKDMSSISTGRNVSESRPILKSILNVDSNQLTKQLYEENTRKEEDIRKLKRELQQSKLTIALNQRKIEELQQQLQQQQQHPQQQQQQDQQQLQCPYRNPHFYLTNSMFHVGDNINIPSSVARTAFDAHTPSKFIITMAHEIWKPITLSQRVVRKQKNTRDRKELTPRKKELLKLHFINYLNEKVKFREIRNMEIGNYNTYLDRAITSAKKKF